MEYAYFDANSHTENIYIYSFIYLIIFNYFQHQHEAECKNYIGSIFLNVPSLPTKKTPLFGWVKCPSATSPPSIAPEVAEAPKPQLSG